MPNFLAIFGSNCITGTLRITSSSFLYYFFSDIAKKWKQGLCTVSSKNNYSRLAEVVIESSTLLDSGVSSDINNLMSSNVITTLRKRSNSHDSYFNENSKIDNLIKESNSIDDELNNRFPSTTTYGGTNETQIIRGFKLIDFIHNSLPTPL